MTQLTLTNDEHKLIQDLLENEITELRDEISNTDNLDFKNMLKEREAMVKKLQKDLQQAE